MGESTISSYSCASVEDALRQPFFEARFNLCANCLALFRITDPRAGDILHRIYSNHPATMRSSEQYNAYYDAFTDMVKDHLTAADAGDPTVLEIGCNDGLMLAALGQKCSARLIGVEPSGRFEKIWTDRSICGINAFFDAQLAAEIQARYGRMDVIIARHVVEHIGEPHAFFDGLRLLASDETTIFVEVPYLLSIVRGFRYENVGYGHLVHYSVTSMKHLLRRHGLVVRGFDLVDVDGGSVLFEIGRPSNSEDTGVHNPEQRAEVLDLCERYFASFPTRRDAFVRHLEGLRSGEVVGFGAGAKGQFLIHLYGLKHFLGRVFDETPGFAGRYIPGTRVRIEPPSFDECPDETLFINLAPTHAAHVRAKIPSRFRMLDPING